MADATTHNHDLEDHIPTLRKLDTARQRSAELRDTGIKVLMECLRPPGESDEPPVFGDWRHENSLVVRALLTRHDQPFGKKDEEKRLNLIKSLIDQLQKGENGEKDDLTLEKLADNELSVLVAASVLRTLTAQPGAAFSKTAMLCCYWIIRELYTADRSDWNIGGARAAPGGLVTAFTTGECIRALLSFADALRNTGKFIEEAGNYWERTKQLENLNTDYFGSAGGKPLQKWVEAEEERLHLSCFLKLRRLSRYLVLPLVPSGTIDLEISVEDCLKKITSSRSEDVLKNGTETAITSSRFEDVLKNGTETAIMAFEAALIDIREYRGNEHSKEPNAIEEAHKYFYGKSPKLSEELSDLSALQSQRLNNMTRSESAHMFAVLAVEHALVRVKKAKDLFCQGNNAIFNKEISEKIKREFEEGADEIHKLLHPVKNYLSSVLDRELALVSLGEKWDWQPCELACAAASYGRLTEKWEKDTRFGRAVSDLSKMVSSRGRFANPRHIHERSDGPRLMMGNAVTLHAMAQLLRYACDSEIETDLADNMLRFFEDTRARQAFNDSSDKKGWGWEFSQPPLKTDLKATASAVIALAEINEMLDARINHIILEHFSVKKKDKGLKDDLTLDSLFYPDYGLRLAPDDNTLQIEPKFLKLIKDKGLLESINRTNSVAITLQRMRAHVSGLSLPKEYDDSLCSLALHGPAGTGKTTLVEALAVTCDVPLVEVTPSDLVKRGEENIEQRARAVFEALSMLTRVVILFDEFDPVLKRRDAANNNPLSVFSFLTPGMLPKLKDLHNGAEKRSVAYVLVTNLIGELDEAAVRQGRFDERLGIYPPDLLSRTGRLLDQIRKEFIDETSRNFYSKKIPWDLILKIIGQTAGKGMTTLGKPGWFTIPDKKREELKDKRGTPFRLLHLKITDSSKTKENLKEETSFKWPEPDDEFKGIRGEGRTAVTECLQWMWITKWDEKRYKDYGAYEHLVAALKDGSSLTEPLEPYFAQSSLDQWEVMAGHDKLFKRRMLIRHPRET